MELKMYRFGDGPYEWVCHESEEKAIEFYKGYIGEDIYQEMVEFCGDDVVEEEPMDKVFTYYHDGVTPDEDTIENHIKKYCKKPDMFASSEF